MGKNWGKIIRGGESLTVEFKRQCPKLERLAKTFSAFSNSSGGHIFFGVEDDGGLCGLEHLEGTEDLVDKVSKFHCDPPVGYKKQIWEPMRGVRVLVVSIPEAEDKPVYAVNPNREDDRWPFFRSEKENLPLDKKSLKTMSRKPSQPVSQHDLKDLDRHAINILERLSVQPRMTLNQLAKGPNISTHRAKKIMVQLEQKGWVHSFFNEKRREYSLAIPWKKR